jgi:NAD-dependent dihydropyrimidine dehydrogenase PreA subunit
MTEKDAHEALLDMYGESALMDDSLRDTLIEVLRLQFTGEEASLALEVGFGGVTLDAVHRKTGLEEGRLRKRLRTMALKGTMWITPGSGDPEYRTIGIAGPGLIETGGWGNVRFPHSVKLLKALRAFQIDFAKKMLARLPVPVARVWAAPAALPEDASEEDDVFARIARAGYWGVSTCSCRLPHWVSDPGDHCEHLLETCLFLGENARWGIEHGLCRGITLEEALDIMRRCHEDGLVHSYDPDEFICNCCPDCCVLQIGHAEPGACVLEHSGFVAAVEAGSCSGCGTCEERCPFQAIRVDDHGTVDAEACLGCGVCVPTCETGSVRLVRRPEEDQPVPTT